MNCLNCIYIRSTSHKTYLLHKIMPLNQQLVQERQLQRAKRKSKTDKSAAVGGTPNNCILTCLSNGSRGSPGSLYVASGAYRYLFNCGEGTQRLAAEHKTKVKNLEHVFFTYKNWEHLGGLPGLSLSLQDMGVTKLFTHGPPHVTDLYHMSKKFLNASEIKISHYDPAVYSDNAMTITAVSIRGSKDNQPNESPTSSPNSNPRIKRLKSMNDDVAFAYVCKLATKLGVLDINKCVEEGVPPGPLLGKLKNKEDITLDDGRIILSSSVTAPDQLGPLFIVVECPTEDFLDDLESSTDWTKYQTGEGSTEDYIAKCIVHFTPSSVMNNPIYQAWMSKFPQDTFHLVLNDSNKSSNSVSIHRLHHKLNSLNSTIFPLPKTTLESEPLPILAKYYLRPTVRLCAEESPDIDSQKFLDELVIEGSDLLQTECEKLKNNIEAVTKENAFNLNDQIYPAVVFLGTGSSVPSEYRNASGMLVNFSPNKSMVLDIGEGTFGQLVHAFGPGEINTVLKNIHCVYVSHPHADHHLGLIQFLKEREKAFADEPYQKLVLITPEILETWLRGYHDTYEPICHLFTMIPNYHLLPQNQRASKHAEELNRLYSELSLKQISTVRVKHCPNAYGIIITNSKGWKIVYSGDTMPCQALVNAGQRCDLLIHEATLQDEMKEEAVYKSHSTTSEAISIGQKMNARFTILTHFSQRYSKIPIFNENFNKSIGVAFDNMRVRPCDLPLLSLFNEPLKAMFAEDYEDILKITTKRLRNKEHDRLNAISKSVQGN